MKKLVILFLVASILVFPCCALNIPSSERIHLGDIIQENQSVAYLNGNVVPSGYRLLLLSPDNITVSDAAIFTYHYSLGIDGSYDYKTPTRMNDGGYIDGISEGSYYACPQVGLPFFMNQDRLNKYCLNLFTVLVR